MDYKRQKYEFILMEGFIDIEVLPLTDLNIYIIIIICKIKQ